jgi:hypothetical protein
MLGPLYGGTGVPLDVPVVVFGEGAGSYCRLERVSDVAFKRKWNLLQVTILCVRAIAKVRP